MAKADRVGSNAAIASIAQVATMATGGALAIVVAATLGNTARTDGFFAAFAVYAIVVSFAQSMRTTIIARMLEGSHRFEAFDRFLGAGLYVVAIAVVAFGVLGAPVAHLVTGTLPDTAYETARFALLVFIPASALQVFAALGAAMLGALGDFGRAGVAFVGGSLTSIVAFVALRPALGIDALPVGLLIGSVISAGLIGARLLQMGWRPSRLTVSEPRASASAAWVLTVSSVSFLVAQIGYLILLGFGARLGVGIVTVFSYATMAMGLLQAIFVSSVPMVLAAPLAQNWDREPASLLVHHVAVVRTGMLLVTPILAAVPLVGPQVLGFVLSGFTDAQVTLLVELFLILSLNVIGGMVSTVPYAALVGIGRYGALGVLTAVAVAVQSVLGLAARNAEDVHLLALSDPAGTVVTIVGCFLVLSPVYARLATLPLLALVARFLLTGLIAFGLPHLAFAPLGDGGEWAALVAGVALYVVLVTRLAADRDVVARLVALLPSARVRAATQP